MTLKLHHVSIPFIDLWSYEFYNWETDTWSNNFQSHASFHFMPGNPDKRKLGLSNLKCCNFNSMTFVTRFSKICTKLPANRDLTSNPSPVFLDEQLSFEMVRKIPLWTIFHILGHFGQFRQFWTGIGVQKVRQFQNRSKVPAYKCFDRSCRLLCINLVMLDAYFKWFMTRVIAGSREGDM